MEQSQPYFECPICHTEFVPTLLTEPGWQEKVQRWMGGEFVQNVWPEASDMDREQLMSSICSNECWDRAFEDLPEDEEV